MNGDNRKNRYYAAAFIVVGIGLLLCIPLGQAEDSWDRTLALAGGLCSLCFGLYSFLRNGRQ